MAETKKKDGHLKVNNTLPIGYVLRGGKYDYRVEEVLGQGSYGITYKVSAQIYVGNIPVRQFFAIKENFVEKYCSRKSDGVTMAFPEACEEARRDINDFLAEGKRLEQLCKGHKNIVNVNETFYANNTAYYTMEYINGGDLCKIVKRNGRISEHEALDIISPIIDAVGYVHEQHVMHYDIKPENIMIRRGENGEPDEPVLIDFGIALHYDINGNLTKTSKDRGVGCSDGYSPMEQYAGDFKFSPESDVYALAATLLYMLSGKVPKKSFDITPEWIERNLPSDIKDQTRSAIIHSMAKLKDDRTKTAGEFAKDLGLSVKTYKYKNEQRNPIADPHNNKWTKMRVMFLVFVAILGAVFYAVHIGLWKNRTNSDIDKIHTDSVEVIDNSEARGDSPVYSIVNIIPETSSEQESPKKKETPSNKEQDADNIVPVKMTNEELFNRAMQDKDWSAIRSLANDGYTPACDALADYYWNLQDFNNAYNWALKSSYPIKKRVIDSCAKYGHLKSIEYKNNIYVK